MGELERAKAVAQAVLPGCRPDTTCMLVAAAVAGLRSSARFTLLAIAKILRHARRQAVDHAS